MKKTYLYHLPLAVVIVPTSVSQSNFTVTSSVGSGDHAPYSSLELSRLSFKTTASDLSDSTTSLSSPVVINSSTLSTNNLTPRGSPNTLKQQQGVDVILALAGVMELREKFDVFLNGAAGCSMSNYEDPAMDERFPKTKYYNPLNHKLLFLDEFYDASKQRLRRFDNIHELLASCERFVMVLVKMSNVSLNVELNPKHQYPYLMAINDIVNNHFKSIPLLAGHEYIVQWLTEHSQLAYEHSCMKTEGEEESTERAASLSQKPSDDNKSSMSSLASSTSTGLQDMYHSVSIFDALDEPIQKVHKQRTENVDIHVHNRVGRSVLSISKVESQTSQKMDGSKH